MSREYNYRENTVLDIFHDSVKKYGDRVFLMKRGKDGWIDLSWNEISGQIDAMASYLISQGLQKGDIVSIYSLNRPEWVVSDYAALSCACVDATIYPTNSSPEAAYIVNDTKSVVCFCEGKFQVDNILAARNNLPSLKKIVVFDDIDYKDEIVIKFSDAINEGKKNLKKDEIAKRSASIKPDDLMTLIYSSGTTGQPKGVMLSHKNIMFIAIHFARVQNLKDTHILLSLLPLSHSVERSMAYYAMLIAGGTLAYSRGTEYFAQDLVEVRPHIGVYVPRVFEKVYNGILGKVKTAPAGKQKIFAKAVAVGRLAAPYFMANKKLPFLLGLKYKLFDKLIFSKLKLAIGFDRGEVFGAAGAPLLPEIHDFFWGMNVQIRKGYGLTETSPTLNVDGDPARMPIKSDGWITPFPETEMKIAEDGEILARGPQVMLGYLNKPEATKEMFTEDGWIKTGDIGVMDSEGYLKITDRKKDIIVTSGGKNVAPQVLENTFASHPMIEQIAVLGDGKKYIVALIVPNFETLKIWANSEGLSEMANENLVKNDKVIKKYESVINELNQHFGRVEQIKKFKLMSKEFTQESGELTPTLKLKRKVVTSRYQSDIDKLYEED
ncbi:MAG TPA: long-chain fatty acid--CoA ligase [Spirochaetota bacterium]|nr:long-chain fatty acid--CoA ligase [Spirochaetota bacterium]HPS87672.1 long-chain fatty acid--CoA ligase [Spirochaetota bacterium]